MECPRCQGSDLIKRGFKRGNQRYVCRACGRHCTDSQPKFSAEIKIQAINMYMNNTGIRAIGRVLGASPAAVLKWIRKEHAVLAHKVAQTPLSHTGAPDIIEMDEIYTYVQKNSSGR